MIKVGDYVLYRMFKQFPELGVAVGFNPENGRVILTTVPNVGSILFEGAGNRMELNPEYGLKLECRHCALRGGCFKYLIGNEKLCNKFFKHIKEHDFQFILDAEVPRF
jgi:hypothetical protein